MLELQTLHDDFRSSVINEPRGSDVLVGALLCPAESRTNTAGVIFFNNVGYLGMCGHGTIGVAVTLAYLGRLLPGTHRLETPAGVVTITLHDAHRVSVGNVASYCHRRNVPIDVPGSGAVRGDVAWGGNWFFLVSGHGLRIDSDNIDELVDYSRRIRAALDASDVRGPGGELIDHIELFGPPSDSAVADSRNFVLCPGLSYDRSPCGTGTSAKIACLVQSGDLEPGETWRQQSITGSIFEASATLADEQVLPTISGSAYVTGRTTLLFDADDPFRHGLRSVRQGESVR
jgi:4-hydroxyproline epimerase